MLLDYELLRGVRVRRLTALNDSKQVALPDREALFDAVVGCASGISVRIVPVGAIDRDGLHRSNLAALRAVLHDLHPPADACLVDGFRLGPSAPPHRAIVDGDARSAAIAAASIVAKVTRDRVMRRLDALYPRYGFASHVGYITPAHSLAVRMFGPSTLHRRSFQARCYEPEPGEQGAAPVGVPGRRDAASSIAAIRPVRALPAPSGRGDHGGLTEEPHSAEPSAA